MALESWRYAQWLRLLAISLEDLYLVHSTAMQTPLIMKPSFFFFTLLRIQYERPIVGGILLYLSIWGGGGCRKT